MKELLSNKKSINTVTILFFVGLLLSIIPIIVASFYSHPLADDFNFSAKVHQVFVNGGGLFEILFAAFSQVCESYNGWQGLYSASFFNSLQPAAFSENLYFLTTVIILLSLIVSTFFIIITLFSSFGLDKRFAVIISCIILFLSIQLVVDKHEAFFWWNGAEAYTLMYSFSLVLISLIIRMYFARKNVMRIVYFVFSLLLAVVVGGGNFSTGLITTVLLGIGIIIVFKTNIKIIPYYSIVFAALLTGFIISVIAPGNSVRAAEVTGESPIMAIIHSVFYAFTFIASWTGLCQIAGFILIALFAMILTKRTNYKYKYPFLVLIITFLVFATQLTPSLYAMSSVGSGRQVNIYYYSYYFLVSFNIFYFCGWINSRKIVKIRIQNIRKSYILCSCLIIVGIFIGGCFNYGFHNITLVDTAFSLKNGTPQMYSLEYMDRIDKIKSGTTTISDIETVPDFFSKFDIKEDPNYWTNRGIANYYNVEKITLKSK